MYLLAATTLEKLQRVPHRFWINLALGLLGAAVAVLVMRHAARMSRLLLVLIVFLFVGVVGVQWVYERNEPPFLSKTIDKVAPFFPKKVEYNQDRPLMR